MKDKNTLRKTKKTSISPKNTLTTLGSRPKLKGKDGNERHIKKNPPIGLP
jgi:hypothetical protein